MNKTCRVTGCERALIAKGLCVRHYKRSRAGQPLINEADRRGEPDGYGRFGLLDEDEEGLLCHECGQSRHGLGTHVYTAHGMTARQYRLAHGLPLTTPLASQSTRKAHSERAKAHIGSSGWNQFEEARDPQKAADSRNRKDMRRSRRIFQRDETQPKHLKERQSQEPWAERHEKWRVLIDERKYPVAWVAQQENVTHGTIYQGVRKARERIGDPNTGFDNRQKSRPLTSSEKSQLDNATTPTEWGLAALKILESDKFVRVPALAKYSRVKTATAHTRIHRVRHPRK